MEKKIDFLLILYSTFYFITTNLKFYYNSFLIFLGRDYFYFQAFDILVQKT